MITPQVSLFASANRPEMWVEFFKSLENTSVKWEVVFAGPVNFGRLPKELLPLISRGTFRYIETAPIKPSQCYEIARRECIGETISWSCDDADYSNDVLGKAYRYWKSKQNDKLILSIQTKESGYGQKDGKLFPMHEHTFFSGMPETPLMCPMNLMSRKFFNDLGGYDRRYICGQAENDLCLRAYQNGGVAEIFGDENCYVEIDHLRKSIETGESTDEESFRERPFAKGYANDRAVLEASWTTFNQEEAFKRLERGERPFSLRTVSPVQLDRFEPYEDKDILIKSQSNNLAERWV